MYACLDHRTSIRSAQVDICRWLEIEDCSLDYWLSFRSALKSIYSPIVIASGVVGCVNHSPPSSPSISTPAILPTHVAALTSATTYWVAVYSGIIMVAGNALPERTWKCCV